MFVDKALTIAHHQAHACGVTKLTELTRTSFDSVVSSHFRLFTPIKAERNRLPVSLPEFRSSWYAANLSDSPLVAAARLGGKWQQHNLAAICHVAACNFRCPYCYVEVKHLKGADSFETSASETVEDFLRLKNASPALSMLRISGGEPLLAPEFIFSVFKELEARALLGSNMLKFETNLAPLGAASEVGMKQFRCLADLGAQVPVHATIHFTPHSGNEWVQIERGLRRALGLGLDIYPAIGGSGWSCDDLSNLYEALEGMSQNLPFRLAVRPFQLDYRVLQNRRRLQKFDESRNSIEQWNSILLERRGVGYLHRPRHEISIYEM